MSNCIGGTSSVLLKRKCFEKVGLFDETLPSFQDYDLWIRISKWFHFDYIKEPLLKYHVHQKKIWGNPEALSQGMQIMLGKYGSSPGFRKYLSYQYLDSWSKLLLQRKHWRSARIVSTRPYDLYPFEIRHYFNLCLSLLGPKLFTGIKELKAKTGGDSYTDPF